MSDSLTQQENIISRLGETFTKGHASGELSFFSSTTSTHTENGIEFEIRLCPSLEDKDKPCGADNPPKIAQKKVNPFLPPYKEGLYLGEITEDDESFVALLNKYSVIEHHFLLCTKEFMVQTSPLTPPELTTAYKLLVAAKRNDGGRAFLMFFNCGVTSGSSQGHKHMQFLPLDDPSGPPIEKLARSQRLESDGKAFSIPSLPYANHIVRLPDNLPAARSDEVTDVLAQAYIRLLDLTIETFMHQSNGERRGPTAYNVLMTLQHLHLIPRGRAEYPMPNGHLLPINALGFAGLEMVKSEAEGEQVRAEGVLKMLGAVGLPDAHGESCSKVENSL